MIYIADSISLTDIVNRLTDGGSEVIKAVGTLNNIHGDKVGFGQPLSIPDSWLKESVIPNLRAQGYVINNVYPEASILETVKVTAKRDYTLYILGAIGIIVAFNIIRKG